MDEIKELKKIIEESTDHLSDKINLLHSVLLDRRSMLEDDLVRTKNPSTHELAKVLLSFPDVPVAIFDEELHTACSVELIAIQANDISKGVAYDHEDTRRVEMNPKEIVVMYSHSDDYYDQE